MAEVRNLTMHQGATFRVTITVQDSDGNPINFNNYTHEAKMKTSTEYEFTTTNVDATAGKFRVTMTPNQTRDIPAGRYYYDVMITQTNTEAVTKVVEGQLNVRPSVTK